MEMDKAHILGDDNESTWSYPRRKGGDSDDAVEDDEEDDKKPAAIENVGDEALEAKVEIQGLSQGTEDTSSLTASLKDPILHDLINSDMSADEKVAQLKRFLDGST